MESKKVFFVAHLFSAMYRGPISPHEITGYLFYGKKPKNHKQPCDFLNSPVGCINDDRTKKVN